MFTTKLSLIPMPTQDHEVDRTSLEGHFGQLLDWLLNKSL